MKKKAKIDLLLEYISPKRFVIVNAWLDRILETGDGNYLGFVVLGKQEFSEKYTGFKKLFGSFDVKKTTSESMTQSQRDDILRGNKKKDLMALEMVKYLAEWEADIQK